MSGVNGVSGVGGVNGVEWSDAHTHRSSQHSPSLQAVLKQSLIAPYEPHPRNATSWAYEIRIAGFS